MIEVVRLHVVVAAAVVVEEVDEGYGKMMPRLVMVARNGAMINMNDC
jgi:hypothetical protein